MAELEVHKVPESIFGRAAILGFTPKCGICDKELHDGGYLCDGHYLCTDMACLKAFLGIP